MTSGYLNVVGTTIQVLDSDKKGAAKQGCYWIYYDLLQKLVLFDDVRRHRHEGPQKVLSDYQGYLQTDGAKVYECYAKVPGITMMGCMAHARRKMFDAKAADKTLAEQALALFGAVYAVEKHIREEGLTGEDKLAFRQRHAVPALHALHAWMLHQYEGGLCQSSPICVAIEYELRR